LKPSGRELLLRSRYRRGTRHRDGARVRRRLDAARAVSVFQPSVIRTNQGSRVGEKDSPPGSLRGLQRKRGKSAERPRCLALRNNSNKGRIPEGQEGETRLRVRRINRTRNPHLYWKKSCPRSAYDDGWPTSKSGPSLRRHIETICAGRYRKANPRTRRRTLKRKIGDQESRRNLGGRKTFPGKHLLSTEE